MFIREESPTGLSTPRLRTVGSYSRRSIIYFRRKLFSTRWRTAIIPFKVLMTFVLSFCKLSSLDLLADKQPA